MTLITSLDLTCDVQKERILELQRNTFESFSEDLYDHILRQEPRGAMGFGIHDEDRLVAFNAFTGHAVHRAGETGIAYQSCMSATDKDYSGRGYFSKIIKHAQHELKIRGGAFIFGFPNNKSGPIFVKNLGFTLADNRPCFFVRTPFGLFGQLDSKLLLQELTKGTSITFDMRETAAWKSEKDDSFFEMDDLTNFVFGKVQRKTVKGVEVRLLVIGGYEINKPHQMDKLINKAMLRYGARIARANVNSHGPLCQASRFRRSVTLTEPTIAYPLNWDVEARFVEACGGLKDVY